MSDAHQSLAHLVVRLPSPYPASFDGSTWRFATALFALMVISIFALKIVGWMSTELVKHRNDAYPTEPLFVFRLIILFSATAAFCRCAPEAAMMITWRENVDLAAQILTIKRWIDSGTIVPSMAWMSLAMVFYPRICMGLVRVAQIDQLPPNLREIKPSIPWDRVRSLAVTIGLVFTIATLIAVGKRW